NRFVPLTSKINEQPYRFPADRALVSVQRGEEEESGHKGGECDNPRKPHSQHDPNGPVTTSQKVSRAFIYHQAYVSGAFLYRRMRPHVPKKIFPVLTSSELAKGDEALRPFLLACETKHLKLITIAIGCIQKLISFRAIPEVSFLRARSKRTRGRSGSHFDYNVLCLHSCPHASCQTSVRTILRTLNDVIVHGVEIQLKILQTVLPLLTNYDSVHDEVLAEALLICFRLQDSKIVVVNNTAAATLRQLVIFTFDKVAKEDNAAAALPPEKDGQHPLGATPVGMANETTVYLRPCAKDAYYLFQDLCILTNGEHPVYLRLNHLSRTFGLELIESVLTNHFKLFRKVGGAGALIGASEQHTEFSSLLRERVCPLIIKNMSDKHDFPQTMRLTRVVYILIKQFNEILVMECEIFLSMFVKILEPENPLWQRVLSMEIFRGVCGDPLLLRSIFAWYDRQDRSTNVFRDMISAFGKLAAERPQLVGATQGGRESLDYGTGGPGGTQGYYQHYAGAGEPGLSVNASTMKIQCIDQLDKADSPPIPETYIYYLSLICLNSIAEGLAGFVLPIFSAVSKQTSTTASTASPSPSTSTPTSTDATSAPTSSSSSTSNTNTINPGQESHPHHKDIILVTDMANIAWPGLLAALSFFFSANLDEELFHGVMRAYQNFTNVCGVLKLTIPRDAFLTSLCKAAVPVIPIFSSPTDKIFTGSSTSLSLTAAAADSSASINLSDKNLYCLRVLLNVTMFLGGVLGDSWYLVLETLQQADHLLFGRPTPRNVAVALAAVASVTSGLRRQMSTASVASTSTIGAGGQGGVASGMFMEGGRRFVPGWE
ncbi:guanine nucleotide exchange factor in Golgi transport N-terminal-domain-containing protein, partial [Jimgerdemannia flammicorona]